MDIGVLLCEVIKNLCLEPLGLTVTDAAKGLGISPEMAVRLSIAFNTSSESWLNQQTQYRGNEYQQRNIRCSMSRKGNCWDNTVMESFLG